MKKLIGISLILCLTGCACTRKENKTNLYKVALADTNASLTQCRDENQSLHEALVKLEAELNSCRRSKKHK